MALQILARKRFSVCILTKSGLVVRDIDLIVQMPGSSVGFSLAFQDENVRRMFEANAPANDEKLKALRTLKSAGIRTYTLICPFMPFISDVEKLIDMATPDSDAIWVYALSMENQMDRNWGLIKRVLEQHFPELVELYRQISFSADHPYWAELHTRLEKIKHSRQLDLMIEL